MRIGILMAAICSLALLASSCSDVEIQASDLADGLEDAWDEAEEPIEKLAYSYIDDLNNDASQLGKDFATDWNSVFDVFTVKNLNPIDQASKAAMSLLLGDFGEGIASFNSALRDSADKNGATNMIKKSFNNSWATLFISLLAVDGSLHFVIETDSWSNNSFDFDTDDIYRILKGKGYLVNSEN